MPDNGIALERREAQGPPSVDPRAPEAADPGNGTSPWARGGRPLIARQGTPRKRPGASPALHPSFRGKRKNRKDAPASQITGAAERWLKWAV